VLALASCALIGRAPELRATEGQIEAEQTIHEEPAEKAPVISEAEKRLLRGKALMGRGDFEGALKEHRQVLIMSPKSPLADKALYNMGLIHIHYENPEKDYRKSMALFKRLVREFPSSPLVEEARIWIGMIDVFEKSKQVDIEIEEKKREITK
jgi:TolA-binding protein